jgi:hypothetical protein
LPLLDTPDKAVSISDKFPLLSNVLSIVAVLPMYTTSRERDGSVTNTVKDKLRSSLQASNVNNLMMIKMSGPILKYLDITRGVEHSYLHAKGFRHIKATCNQYIRCGCQK